MSRDRITSRGRSSAPSESGSGAGPDNQGTNGRGRPQGGGGRGNWFVRHKVISFVMVTVVALGLVATGLIVSAMNDPARYLLNRTTPPAVTEETETPPETDSPTTDPATASPTDTMTVEPTATEQLPPDYLWDANTVNILVLGTDSNAARVKMGMNARTDCIMLVSINVEKKKASLISIPRDVYVKIYSDRNKVYTRNRINAAFTFGGGLKKKGIPFAMNTVNQFLSNGKIPIDHYVLFDMDLVKKLIDAVGKIDVDVQINATIHGMVFKKGMMKLNGSQALAYARDRHNTAGGDVGRVGHQQQVMISLLKKLKDTNTVVTRIPELYKAFSGNLATDMTDPMQILALAFVAKDMDLAGIKQYTIKGTGLTVRGASMIVADQTYKQQVMREVFGVKVPIDSTWTYSRLKGEIEAKLNAGKSIVNTASSFLSNNAGYYSGDEAQALKNAISTWNAASKKNDTDQMTDAQQDVQTQYDILKDLVDGRKAAIEAGRGKISWARGQLNDLNGYLSDADKSTVNGLIAAVQTCVDNKDYANVGAATQNLDSKAKEIFGKVKPTDPPATDPPATDPPATDPPATDTPATDPPATDTPVTESAAAAT